MAYAWFITVLFSMASLSLAAWNEPEEFRGLKLGQNLKDQVRECPKNSWDAKERCWQALGQPKVDGSALYSLYNFGPIGTLPQGNMIAQQVHDRLVTVRVIWKHDHYARLRDIVVERYGPPTSEETEEVVTKAGVKWPNRRMSWNGARVSIVLDERSSRVDETSLHVFTAEFFEHERRKQREERKKGSSDL